MKVVKTLSDVGKAAHMLRFYLKEAVDIDDAAEEQGERSILWTQPMKNALTDTAFLVEDYDLSDGYHTFEELYKHRNALFAALLVLNKSTAWYSNWHDDMSMFKDYIIAGFDPEEGVGITYHLQREPWAERFRKAGITHLPKAPPWDGHTSHDVVDRLVRGFFGE